MRYKIDLNYFGKTEINICTTNDLGWGLPNKKNKASPVLKKAVRNTTTQDKKALTERQK